MAQSAAAMIHAVRSLPRSGSPARGAEGAAVANGLAGLPGVDDVPQRWQNFAPGESSVPHAGHVRAPRDAPQWAQKFPLADWPQAGHVGEELSVTLTPLENGRERPEKPNIARLLAQVPARCYP